MNLKDIVILLVTGDIYKILVIECILTGSVRLKSSGKFLEINEKGPAVLLNAGIQGQLLASSKG